jgi:Family of unknown function (DUF5996)
MENTATGALLAPLPYESWEPTKTTLHLFAQIVGKIQLGATWHRNHWWNVTFATSPRGLRTHLMQHDDTFFEIEFDFIDHRVNLRSNRIHDALGFPLYDGLSVAEFYDTIFGELGNLGLSITILAKPYGVPMTTPFPEDRAHHTYDRVMVRRWWDVILWTTDVMQRFASQFAGKQSEPQIFWHSLDLAMARFSGRRADGPPRPDLVQKEAYSHDVISFGFWAGDANVPEPTYYTYTAPEPQALAKHKLRPESARWVPSGNGHLGTIPYESVRTATDPANALLTFYQSGYEAGIHSAHWDAPLLASLFPNL